MKQIFESVGIDVSKEKFDAHLHVKQLFATFSNDKKGFKELVKWVKLAVGKDLQSIIFCFEITGIYSIPLGSFLSEKNFRFAMVPALQIKKSMGMVRGKSDTVDAKRIAEYAYLRRDSIKPTELPSATIQELKALLSQRERLVTQRAGFLCSLKELKIIFKRGTHPELFKHQEKLRAVLTEAIKDIEQAIQKLIQSDAELHRVYKLIISVKGIGLIVAANLLAVTNCFTAFENSRQLACYCGVAPFEKQSGSSLNKRPRVSNYANKRMKVLLNLAASSAILRDKELKQYYQRRVEQGKSRMSTLNIVRNKLLHRIFAVVKRDSPYVEMQRWAA